MRWIGSSTNPVDPIDAVMDGDVEGGDLLAIAAIVHDLVAAYDRGEPLEVRPELAAFCGTHLATGPGWGIGADEAPTRAGGVAALERAPGRKRRMLGRLGGFAGTVAGKVLLTSAVAAAGVGGLHAAGAVDVPALPDDKNPVERPEPATDRTPRDGADHSQQAPSAGNRRATEAYTDAVDDWTDCVADAASVRGDEETRTSGRFDPTAACGEHPRPDDFGLGEVPEQASDRGEGGPGETPPGGTGSGSAGDRPDTPTDAAGPTSDGAGGGDNGDDASDGARGTAAEAGRPG